MAVLDGREKMKCGNCKGGKYRTTTGRMSFTSPTIGRVMAPNVEFKECNKCKNKLLSPDACRLVVEYIVGREQEFIKSLPIGKFITMRHAAELLCMSPHKFRRHPKIQKGFILSAKIGNRKYYHTDSVLKYKRTGDGRKIK